MAADIVWFGALNLTLNHVKCVCHSYFSVLIIEICQSTNYFVSVSLPLCTKLNGLNYIICFRRAINIHRTEFRLETSQPNWDIKRQAPLYWTDLRENVVKWMDYDSRIAKSCDLWQTVDFYELWTTENQTKT